MKQTKHAPPPLEAEQDVSRTGFRCLNFEADLSRYPFSVGTGILVSEAEYFAQMDAQVNVSEESRGIKPASSGFDFICPDSNNQEVVQVCHKLMRKDDAYMRVISEV